MKPFYTKSTSPLDPNMKSLKLIYPAATRNRGPILEVLQKELPKYFNLENKLYLLEIASGSGQHIAHFAPHFPNIIFQPSDYTADVLTSISIYADDCSTKNMMKPILIDAKKDLAMYGFEKNSIDIIYCCNMIHVSPYDCTIGLFSNAGNYLKDNGVMITYGAYAIDGVISPQSNVDFDKYIKSENPEWGLRCTSQLSKLAKEHGISLKDIFDLPANNKCIIWKKDDNKS